MLTHVLIHSIWANLTVKSFTIICLNFLWAECRAEIWKAYVFIYVSGHTLYDVKAVRTAQHLNKLLYHHRPVAEKYLYLTKPFWPSVNRTLADMQRKSLVNLILWNGPGLLRVFAIAALKRFFQNSTETCFQGETRFSAIINCCLRAHRFT